MDADLPGEAEMANVEHLGQYVYEMTKSKVDQVRNLVLHTSRTRSALIPSIDAIADTWIAES
jgi:hypothetical protein